MHLLRRLKNELRVNTTCGASNGAFGGSCGFSSARQSGSTHHDVRRHARPDDSRCIGSSIAEWSRAIAM